jgi:hypothetical protein
LDLALESFLQGLRVSLLKVHDYVRRVVFFQLCTILSVNVIPKHG